MILITYTYLRTIAIGHNEATTPDLESCLQVLPGMTKLDRRENNIQCFHLTYETTTSLSKTNIRLFTAHVLVLANEEVSQTVAGPLFISNAHLGDATGAGESTTACWHATTPVHGPSEAQNWILTILNSQRPVTAPTIKSNHPHLMLCFERQSVHSNTSCMFPPALLMAMDNTDTGTMPTKMKTSNKTVRFRDDILIQAREIVVETKEELQKMWYSTSDYESFRKENLALAQSFREKMELGKTSWFELFQAEYENVCKSPPNKQEEQTTPSQEHLKRFHTSYLGLESLVLQAYLCDRARRQEAMYNQVDYWQKLELLDKSSQEKILRTICQNLSRPCCHMAIFLAKIVERAVTENL